MSIKNVFVSGASGYCGKNVVKLLREKNYEVVGLCRSQEGVDLLKQLGATPFVGDLKEPEKISACAATCDAVIHLAFSHDFSKLATVLENDRNFVQSLLDAMKGSNKRFIVTSVPPMAFVNSNKPNDDIDPVLTEKGRGGNELLVLRSKDVQGISVRLPPFVYGQNGPGFAQDMIQIAKKCGEANYVEGAENSIGVTHVEDVARLYVAALEKGKPGAVYNGCDQSVPFKQLSEAISKNTGLPLKGVTKEEAEKIWEPMLGPLVSIITSDLTCTSSRSKSELGWEPVHPVGIIEDVVSGSYKTKQ